MKKILLLPALLLPALSSAQTQFGIDIGQPINVVTGDLNPGTDTALIGDICAPWVRINFILGPWTSPGDQTLHSGRTWQQAYDEIINRYSAKGIQVYGLIGAEACTYPADTLEQFPGPDSAAAVSWISNYTYNFVQIVDMFKDRVRVFETFNEPNNWTNSPTEIVHPAWFSLMQQEIYLNTKFFNGHDQDSLWQVKIISGALFTFDLNSGSQYISDTYWYGKNYYAWDWIYSNYGTYPLDGFGQHIYVLQGDSDATAITNAMNFAISDFRSGAYQYETDASKKNYISEYGWETTVYGESFQAGNLTTSFNALQGNADVGLALWFTLSDFPGGDWGLYYFGNYLPSERKQSWTAFRNFFNCPSLTTGVSAKEEKQFACRLILLNENYYLDYSLLENSRAHYTIHDICGRQVMEKTIQPGQVPVKEKIETESLPAGSYFITLFAGNERYVFRLAID